MSNQSPHLPHLNRTMWEEIQCGRGHTYRSIPTDVPQAWKRRQVSEEEGGFQYESGEYVIERWEYGKRWSFSVSRQTVQIGDFLYPRLSDAKQAAIKNAKGKEVRHFA